MTATAILDQIGNTSLVRLQRIRPEGAEIWVKPRVALFGELDFARIKGKATDDSEFNIDDRARSLLAGIRVHLGG